ncbi:Transmembrane protein [Galdieria sulphuraria]|uniref:Uncharacterized protein n=1 Tax=Galdieria sulphuraria TaxID=130081 RepID=M2XR88_GALSU|nr:uncharacterized protein Gasu_01250 [Galdieria sulphuraria]EME32762.1 hypothetical protein Gasu_01250 [Galdieria sulphuraria]GJD09191.1 Transmembrane protein [Galdieria sulphuraria]|eukprot:XP_005709282.1 hypothetical protein Gasu_01250 [Galdieria sulphuraria]
MREETYALILSQVVAGLFALSATCLSSYQIFQHLTHYVRPEYQLHICRILGMVPIYSITAWLALVLSNSDDSLLLDVIRDSYEAYVIYNFLVLLINAGGGERQLTYLLELKPRMRHPWPLQKVLAPIQLGADFLYWTRAACLQFVFVKPASSMIAVWLNRHGLLGEGIDFSKGSVYLAFVNNVSVSIALYALILFYFATEDLLSPFRPLPKFLAVKMVVFFSFWQGLALACMVWLGVLKDVEGFDAKSQATGLQDLLICIEMLVASICHHFVFSYEEFEDYAPDPKRPLLRNFGDIVDIRDVLSDAKDTLSGSAFERELREGEPIIPGTESFFSEDGSNTSPSSSIRRVAIPRFSFD